MRVILLICLLFIMTTPVLADDPSTEANVSVGVIDSEFNQSVVPIESSVSFGFESNESLDEPIEDNHGAAVSEIILDQERDIDLYQAVIPIGQPNSSFTRSLEDAIDWMIDSDVDVLVLPFGVFTVEQSGDSQIDRIVEDAIDDGITVVSSAGNHADKHWIGQRGSFSIEGILEERLIVTMTDWDQLGPERPTKDVEIRVDGETKKTIDTTLEMTEGWRRINVTGGDQIEIRQRGQGENVTVQIFSSTEISDPIKRSSIVSPSTHPQTITVGSWNEREDQIFPWSSRGPIINSDRPGIDVLAPGTQETRADPSFRGTSASAPFVAGIIASAIEIDPSLDPTEIEDLIHETASNRTPKRGVGLIREEKILTRLDPIDVQMMTEDIDWEIDHIDIENSTIPGETIFEYQINDVGDYEIVVTDLAPDREYLLIRQGTSWESYRSNEEGSITIEDNRQGSFDLRVRSSLRSTSESTVPVVLIGFICLGMTVISIIYLNYKPV